MPISDVGIAIVVDVEPHDRVVVGSAGFAVPVRRVDGLVGERAVALVDEQVLA